MSRFSILAGFLLLLSLLRISTSQPDFLYHFCTGTNDTFSRPTYQSNRNTLLASFRNTNTSSSAFQNSSVGQSNDKITALSLCRGDVLPESCRKCVNDSAFKLPSLCPNNTGAISWYDNCMFRYSDSLTLGQSDTSPTFYMWNNNNFTGNITLYNGVLGNLMNELRTTASLGGSAIKFAIETKKVTSFQNLYGLVQCTPDLTENDCGNCLDGAISEIPTCCDSKQGGRVVKPSCNLRFEAYLFYNQPNATSPETSNSTPPAPNSTSTTAPTSGKKSISSGAIVAIVVSIVSVLFFVVCYFMRKRTANKTYKSFTKQIDGDITTEESLQFDFCTIEAATNGFSDENKVGEGGFGVVYKGTLANGREIAVKRLSKGSGQGAAEFKNEVVLLAKLQHRNLVRLFGFCLEGEEHILVYEFVPNKSLDYFLYDSEKKGQLDWSRRYKIIGGVARGILYLHEDSRLRIIHRDLKASNVLLDVGMNPKISDFGMAKIFGGDQTQGNTSRIVGTYGYMSPEYAMHGHFSVKSDVFSFGVLILEIITGHKNSSFYQTNFAQDLLTYVWKLWNEGNPLELMDSCLEDSHSRNEVLRCIHIGLLCVQNDESERPTMATVVVLLNSYSITLPLPQQPAYFLRSKTESDVLMKDFGSSSHSTTKSKHWSVNEASMTDLYPR